MTLNSPSAPQTVRSVTVAELRAALTDGHEIAVIDVRPPGIFNPAHLLYAVNAPLGRLELVIGRLVPRPDTRLVVTDEREELAGLAARRLAGLGYTDVQVLAGGTAAWAAAGHELFASRNTPGIVFGEVVEHALQTPNISARELRALQDSGAPVALLDVRLPEEFEAQRIPGGILAEGVETLFRLHALDLAPDTPIVVHCGGRTRAILGAQNLISAGVTNPVYALTGGTMEWLIADYPVEHGPGPVAPFPDAAAIARARAQAVALADKVGVRRIDAGTLARFEADQGTRTLYRFDVRSPEEYQAGHRAGWRSVPGGELAARIVKYVATRGARIVLHDRHGVRDLAAAAWLHQQGGHEVFVLEAPEPAAWEAGPEPLPVRYADGTSPVFIDAAGLRAAGAAATVFDIESSADYGRGHIAGAQFAPRADLPARIADATGAAVVVVTSRDGVLAAAAAAELARDTGRDVRALLGGTLAWQIAGGAVDSGGAPGRAGDVWQKPGGDGDTDARNRHFRAYLDWEVSLVDQLRRDGDTAMRVWRPVEAA